MLNRVSRVNTTTLRGLVVNEEQQPMQRRKFIAGLGSLTAAGAAGIGTGAFTSVSANRGVSVTTAGDESAFLGLEAGDLPYVTGTDDGQMEIDLTETAVGGQGVNMDAVTTIGDPNNPADEHAFKIVNQGTQSLMFKMNYYFENTGWIVNRGKGQSHINFEVFADATESYARNYPDQRATQGPGYQDHSLGHPEGGAFGSNEGENRFNVGEEYYVVITIRTTGPNAATSDDLSGTAVIMAEPETEIDRWNPANPPSV